MKLKYAKSTKTHPLESVVLEMAEAGKILDVSSVAPTLAGGLILNNAKANKAYRIIAADVLGYMVCAGRLVQHGKWAKKQKPEDGGPFFTLPNAPSSAAAKRSD